MTGTVPILAATIAVVALAARGDIDITLKLGGPTKYGSSAVLPRSFGDRLGRRLGAIRIHVAAYSSRHGGEVKPLSREYFAVFVRGGEFIKIYERAATPDAAYGAEGNKRHATACEWNKTRAGYKKWELGNDGTMTFFDNDTYEVNGVRMRIQESYSTTPDHPAVIPYETVTTRTFYNSRNRVVREEHWIALENDGRELLDWKEYERNVLRSQGEGFAALA